MGDEVLDTLYRRYYPLLREKCRRMLADRTEADDVAQETFVRFWQAAPRTSGELTTTAWLYRTSTNLAIDRLRSTAARAKAVTASDDTASDGSGQLEARSELARLAQHLPKEELQLLALQRLDGLTLEELAQVSGRSPRTVRRLLARCEARLSDLTRALT